MRYYTVIYLGNVLKNGWWDLVNNCLVSARRYEEEASTGGDQLTEQ